jgi:hypothetical protein
MYAFAPLIGTLSDRLGRVRVIQLGFLILLAAAIISGLSPAMSTIPLGIGLFLLGLGWSCTLIAGSTYLSESVAIEMKPASQGASDLVMNLRTSLRNYRIRCPTYVTLVIQNKKIARLLRRAIFLFSHYFVPAKTASQSEMVIR